MKAVFRHFSLFFLFLLISCTPEIDILEDSFRSSVAELSGSGQNLRMLFDSNAGSASVELSANLKWEASFINDRASWCTLSMESGKRGTVLLTITVNENTTYDERSASIAFTCKDAKQTLVVVQKQKDAVLLSSAKLEVPEEGGIFNLEVQHNIDYTVEIDEAASSWIRILRTKALSAGTVSLQVDANESFDSRTGKVYVRSSLGKEAISVYQQAATPVIVLTQKEYAFSDEGGQFIVEIKSNVDYEYAVTEGSEWLSEVRTKSMSTHTLQFRADVNGTYDNRTGKIRFSDKEHGLVEEVIVRQKQKDALLISSSEYDVSDEGAIITVEVKSNVEFAFEVTEGAAWISQIQSKGLTTHTLEFAIKANETYDNRTGTIRFYDAGSGLSETVTVRQKQKDALILKESEFHVSAEGEIVSVEINSNLDFGYEITEGGNWISEIRTKGLSSHTLQFKVGQNLAAFERQGAIVFRDTESGISQTVVIFQEESLVEKKILLEILESCTSESWKNQYRNLRWKMERPLREWRRVGLNAEGRIDSLDLSFFEGKIPDAIGGLSELRYLSVERGQLDAFPKGVCNCTKLEVINFSGYYDQPCFEGTLPASFSKLKQLRIVNFKHNAFPSFPSVLCQCTNLEELNLGYGTMKGSIPEGIGALNRLSHLALFENPELTGSIPEVLFSLPCWKCYPLDIICETSLEASVTDLVAPDFDITDIDGNRIISRELYANHRYTILYTCESSFSYFYTVDLLRDVWKEIPECINIVFCLKGSAEQVQAYRDQNNIPWPCLPITKETILSGQTGYNNIYQKGLLLNNCHYVVDQKGSVIYCSGFSGIESFQDDIGTFLLKAVGREYGYYTSSDYSHDGEVIQLQKATEGNGIDLVFMGDGYSDRYIADGTYLADMKRGMEGFFSWEPYQSFRQLFNVYAVFAVSKNDQYDLEYGTETAFSVDVTGASGLRCNDMNRVREYALKALDNDKNRYNYSTITTIIRSKNGRSVCYLGTPGQSPGRAFCITGRLIDGTLNYIIGHEAGGHGFGLLGDEYVDSGVAGEGRLQSLLNRIESNHSEWYYMNLDVTNDPDRIAWSKFLKLSEYAETVGIYEGGYYLSKGVYRPSETSIMRSSSSRLGYNAPSREAIYYWIHRKGYGESWVYRFEDFLAYDKINLQTPKTSTGYGVLRPEPELPDIRELTAPPIWE